MKTRGFIAIGLATAMLAVPTAAEAAKVKVSGGTIAVADDGTAGIKLKNPNGSRAKGKLTLRSGTVNIGSKRFSIAGHRKSTARVRLSNDALQVLANGDGIAATAYAAAKGRGTSSKKLVLYYPGAQNGGGGGNTGGGGGGGQAWQDGRWQGTYADNNVDLAFNVTGARLYTGPFDSFFVTATCHNVDPGYTGPNQTYTDSSAVEPVEATINSDGSFSGSGTYRPSADLAMPWTISGQISGQRITGGAFSVSYTDYHGNPCSGTANFSAAWYGDYTLKPVFP